MDAPEVIVRPLDLRRLPERRDRNAQGAGRVEDTADGAVLARRVRALENDQQGALPLRIEAVLQGVDVVGELLGRGPGGVPVVEAAFVARVALLKVEGLARFDPQPFDQVMLLIRHCRPPSLLGER
jgi:hypothetical protein